MDQFLWEDIQQVLWKHHATAVKEIETLFAECAALSVTKGNGARPEEIISPYLTNDMDPVPCSPQASDTETLSPSSLPLRSQSIASSVPYGRGLQDMQDVVDSCNSKRPLKKMQKHLEHFISSNICCALSAPKSRTTSKLGKLVRSKYFEGSVMFVILSNFCYTIFDTNWKMRNKTDMATQTMHSIEYTFIWIYFTELVLKLHVFRLEFFLGTDMCWNIFDIVLVLIGLLEVLSTSGAKSIVNPSFARIVRTLKTLRKVSGMVRMMHFFPELRLMIKCISGSLGSLFWCVVILFGTMLCFAVLFVQQMTWYVIEKDGLLSEEELDQINDGFGSVQQGTLSLFSFIAGGAEWGDAFVLMEKCGTSTAVFFVTYVLLIWISLNNIIASIYVDKALKYAQADSDDQIKKEAEESLKIGKHLTELFKSMDDDGSGSLSLLELQRNLTDARVTALLGMQGIQIKDVETFFETVRTAGGSDEVDVETFVMGCLNMRGPASSMELFTVSYKLQTQLAHCLQVIDKLDHAVQAIHIKAAQQTDALGLPLVGRVCHPTTRSCGKL